MSRLLYTALLMLSLSQRQASVEAGSIPTPDEIELSILKITVTEQEETLQRITERLKSIITIESELYDTRDLLAQTLIQLTSNVEPKEKEISTDHIIRKRHDSGEGSGHGGYLNLQALIPQLTARDGRDGINGKPGLPGTPGVDGTPGSPGPDGQNGQNGQDGADGTPGPDGTLGLDGSDGAPGLKGAPGDPGIPVNGEPGSAGITGEPGPPGDEGSGGSSGEPGEPGQDGSQGSPGTPGSIEPGEPGSTGEDGQKGEKGEKGELGESVQRSAGAVYTRWGRTSCGGGAYLIYIGFTAGGYYDAVGGGVNFQCLPHTPQYNKFSGSGGSIITGVEYGDGASVFPQISKHHDNVPCARCLIDRTALMMYPASKTCPSGWTLDYQGYLMSGHSAHDLPTTYVCMDGTPEFVSSSSSNLHGGLLNFVSPKCKVDGAKGDTGTISCTPYYMNKELTCAVCSK